MAWKQVFYFIHWLILCFAIANGIEVKFHVGKKCGNNAECVWNIAGKGKNDFLKCEKILIVYEHRNGHGMVEC